jgi:hypothetical protein
VIFGICCTVVLGLVALWQTLVARVAIRRVAELELNRMTVQQTLADFDSRLKARKAQSIAMSVELERAQQAIAARDADALAEAIRAAASIARGAS